MPSGTPEAIRIVLPVCVGGLDAEVVLEPAHYERLFRVGRFRAIRDGLLAPDEAVCARLVPGAVAELHGTMLCLSSCGVELSRPDGEIVTTMDFPRETFAAFAAARAVHCLAERGASLGSPVRFSLHAEPDALDPLPVALPALQRITLPDLLRGAAAWGMPEEEWIVTAIGSHVLAGLRAMEEESRMRRVETAGRIVGRVGFDPDRRLFVRVLDRLLITRATEASAFDVVSTAQSWAEVPDADDGGVRIVSTAHVHLHLDERVGDAAEVDPTADGGDLGAARAPCVSIQDVVSHYVSLPDPLSAMIIASIYPGDRRVVALYGYGDDARLRAERGWWLLPTEASPHAYESDR